MEKYYCPYCQKIFEAEGEKREWEDKIYGPCWKKIAICPNCHNECEEYRVKKNISKEEKNCSGNCSCCGTCFG